MGSGHFVVAMFERLVALRMAEEGVSEQAAVVAVIQDNLFGLEIDPRCTQIAAFNLALAAWRRLGFCALPALNLACSGLAPNASEAEWLAMAGDNERLRNGIERLYQLFEKASVLGSLINPRAAEGGLLVAGFHELQPLLEKALAQETKDDSAHEIAVTARGLAKAAEILAGQFTLVATNVPYLGRGKQDEVLKEYCGRVHPKGKADLATCFIERCLALCAMNGSTALVTPQNWWFLGSYRELRKQLLANKCFNAIVTLGEEAWQSFGNRGPVAALIVVTASPTSGTNRMIGIDSLSRPTIEAKIAELLSGEAWLRLQLDQQKNPDHRLTIEPVGEGTLLERFAEAHHGLTTGDSERMQRQFWESNRFDAVWIPFCNAPNACIEYSGRSRLLQWNGGTGAIDELLGARKDGQGAWGKTGVLVRQMRELSPTVFSGEAFDNNTAAIVPHDPQALLPIWAFISSPEYQSAIRRIDQKVSVTSATLVKVPFNLAHWQKVAAEKYPHGLPKPFSSDPTQWLFSGHPAGADQPLHVALARLLSYLWPRQTGSGFPDCPALDPDGLESLADQDGIVCLSPTRGEAAAVDRLRGLLAAAFGDEWSNARERELLLETAVANDAKKAAADLSDWLRQNFFAEHCKLYQSRPFIWQIWDGNPQGFSALVNYHKLAAPNGQGRKTLESLTYTYLGDWIDRQKLDQAEGVNGADDRLAAALDLQGQLKKILEGEPPYDIFVRWKPLQQQAIGWDPDINDGVRLNIRPFLSAQLRKGGKTGAGILRAKPGTIKWAKDRGKEPMRSKDDFPWFWGWDENSPAMATDFGAPVPGAPPAGDSFDGNRWNDLHYTRAAKEAARARHRGEG